MPSSHLDVEIALDAWDQFNNVRLHDVTPRNIPGRGVGFIAGRDLDIEDASSGESPALVTIPRDLVLSQEAIEVHAKVDGHFRELLEAAGRKSTRTDVCLFLLVQRALASVPDGRGVRTPWAQYVRFLPSDVPVPSTWSAPERQLLQGTSLEPAVRAKINALTEEFEELQEKTRELPYWNQFLWEDARVTLDEWFLMDAWYRSRSLELPHSGEAMVPVLDLANHSSDANAYYEEDSKKDQVELLRRPGTKIDAGEEVTISYGEGKSGAEMLFSYGFVDPARSTDTVTLPLAPMDDDPLGRAKAHIFGRPGTVEVGRTSGNGSATWRSPFAWLACLNEEDGLEFRVLQDTGGGRELRVFWQDEDVTERVGGFEELVRDHPLSDMFKLRVVMVVEDRVTSQLDRLRSESSVEELSSGSDAPGVRAACVDSVETLRVQESSLLEAALQVLEEQKESLLKTEVVVAYLGSKEISRNGQVEDEVSNDSEDFS